MDLAFILHDEGTGLRDTRSRMVRVKCSLEESHDVYQSIVLDYNL